MFDQRPLKFRTTQHADPPTATDFDHIRGGGYVRVITDAQVNKGVSLEGQFEKIKAYCKGHDVELIDIYKAEG